MSQTVNLDRAEIAQAELAREGLSPGPPMGTVDEIKAGKGSMDVSREVSDLSQGSQEALEDDQPTEEELHTLRRVAGHM